MTQIITHRASSFEGTTGGLVYVKNVAGTPTAVVISVPTGVAVTATRPYFAGYAKRVLIGGKWQQVMILTEDNTFHRAGIAAPTVASYDATNNPNGLRIQAVAGSSTGGTYIGYVSYAHKIGDTVVHESNLSAGTPPLTTTSVQSRSWTGIPTTSTNPRVTHIRFWLSVAGGEPKLAMERSIGLSTLTESVLDGELLEFSSDRRGVPPPATMCEVYHDRVWYNNPSYPERLYYSELNEPESVHSLNFIPTRDGEAITAMKARGDELVVFCKSCTYVVQGFVADDFAMRKVSSHIGCEASHSVVNLDDVVIFLAGKKGMYAYNGSFRPLSESDLADFLASDYASNIALYQDSQARIDREERTYNLLIPKSAGFSYVATTDTSEPWWGTDSRVRKDYCYGNLDGLSYTGSTDGYVRKENVATDDDDDDDGVDVGFIGKTMTIVTRHETGEDLGGREDLGKRWFGIDVFAKSEDKAITLSAYTGEESATDSTTPAYTFSIPAGASSGYVAKNRRHVLPPSTSGSGITLKFVVVNAKNVQWRGYALDYETGRESRQTTS